MRHIFVRPARAAEAQRFLEWSVATPNNLFDKDVASYPSTKTLCAYNKQGPVLYVPRQQVFFLESLAINPEASEIDIAAALKEITQNVVSEAHEKGVGEIYFLCRDEATLEFAKRQCFEELPWRLCRIRLKDLECESAQKPSLT